MSLRARLVVLVLGLTTLLLGGLGWYLSRAFTTWAQDVLDQELAHRAEVLSSEVKWEHGELEVEDEVGEFVQDWPWRIETPDGRVLASSRFDLPALPAPTGRSASVETLQAGGGRQLRVLSRTFVPHHGRGQWLVLRVAAPASTFAGVAGRFRVGLLVALALAAVLGAVGAALVAHVFLSPLRRLSREVAGIEARSLSTRLQTRGLDPELGRLASAFNGVLDRLEQTFEGQRAFIGRASHALRTPLSSILSQAEVTLRRERSAEEYRAALAGIASAARESAGLAQALLALNRADAAKGGARRERLAAATLAEEVLRLFRARAEEAGLQLRSEAEEGLVLDADRGRLREMLDALMDNALRYTPSGGQVRFEARAEGGDAVLEVSDTGLGITPAERDEVTERFFRGSAAHKTGQPGSGLGLSVVQALARAEGARLCIADAPGGGTRVSVRLPRAGPGH